MRSAEQFRRRYGSVALIVGGSEGIGAAFAEQLAQRGLDLLLVARNAGKLDAFARSIEERYGRSCRTLAADMAAVEGAEAVATAAGEMDVGLLIYNAASAPAGAFLERSMEDHLTALSVNSRAVVVLAHSIGKRLVSRGHGGIIIMCSLAGLQGAPWLTTYGATKAFDISLAEALHAELGASGVDVLGCIAGATATPGYARTMAPPKHGRYPFYVSSPEAVARTALKRLGRASLVIVGGVNRTAAFVMRRLLPRRAAVGIMGGASSPADDSRRVAGE